MSAAPAVAPVPTVARSVPRHPVALRIGLVVAVVLSVVNTIPAVSDVGLVGTGWDVVVVAFAVFFPLVTLATLVLVPFAWSGRRTPAAWIAGLQFAVILTFVAPFVLVITGEIPAPVVLFVGAGAVLQALTGWLILHGAEQPRL